MKKLENSKLEQEIIELRSKNTPIRKIANTLNCSTSYIDRILLENKNKISKSALDCSEGFVIKAKCKTTNELFFDIENKSGVLTSHILKLYPEYKIPSSFKRRKQFKLTGKFWYDDFFDFVQVKEEKKEIKKCKYCDWTTYDLDNKSGAYTLHLLEKHEKTIQSYIEEFPEEKSLFKTFLKKNERNVFLKRNENNHILCEICGEKFKKISNTHLKTKHNISLTEYKNEYSKNTLSMNTLGILQENYNNHLKLYEPTFTSKAHLEIIDFLKSLNIEVIKNNKSLLKGVELDILIPDKKLAIEYNGLLYHSEIYGKKLRQYHLNKTKLCQEQGYGLIHIFEDDWQNKKELLKSKLSHILKENNGKVIHARKCDIKQINLTEKNNFLISNHIQGDDNSVICFAAYFKDEIVALMSFDFKRRMINKKTEEGVCELTRFTTKQNYKISGIANRLLKSFIKVFSPTKIISFADRAWTTNSESNLYTNLNFKLTKILPPDYKYFYRKEHNPIRLHKFGFGKSSLRKKFPQIYDDFKSEWEIMQEAGYDRIWDCGKWKYELDLTNQPQNISGH